MRNPIKAAVARVQRSFGVVDPNRAWLLDQLARGGVGAEIGVWRGDFSGAILRVTDPSTLHLIDPWSFRDDPAYEDAWYGAGHARSQDDMDSIYWSVLERFSNEIRSGRVRVHRAMSVEAAAELPDDSLDWVYIDGDHTYQCVLQDLETYSPKVRRGGVIAGDDYGGEGWWEDGVSRAVDEWVGRCDDRALEVRNAQFVIRR